MTEAHKIANKIQKDKQESQHQSVEALQSKAVYTLATKLVQVARNSLLDQDSLRCVCVCVCDGMYILVHSDFGKLVTFFFLPDCYFGPFISL